MSESYNKDDIRNKVIGLGENSFHKSYYPQLQQRIDELEKQKQLLENTNKQLQDTLGSLEVTQESLKSNEYKYRSLFENANDAIFTLDAKQLTIIDCNSKALQMFKYAEKEDLIATSVFELAATIQPNGKSAEEVAQKELKNVFEGESKTFEWLTSTKNNEPLLCVVSISLIEIYDEPVLQAILRDVSKERKFEHELGMATIRTVENERLRFAKELHDGIGPILSTIKLYVEWLKEDNVNEQNNMILNKTNDSIVEATKAIKEIAYNLSPHILANYGLDTALKQFVKNINEINPLNIDFDYQLSERLPSDYEVMLYRVTTELMNNTIKHAKASEVKIVIQIKNKSLTMTYADNGKGFDMAKARSDKKGMGLFNVENRISQVGGYVNMHSEPGRGVNFEFLVADINNFNEK